MTREEAIAYFLKNNENLVNIAKDENVYSYEEQAIEADCMRETFEANEKAIEALEQEPCEDCISRQAVLEGKVIHQSCDGVEIINSYAVPVEYIEQLPSIQPKTQWIPVSERLPEEREWIGTKSFGTTISDEVYVTFEMPNGERFTDHLSFQNGKLSPHKQSEINVWHKGAKPIAWMPLPQPYIAESEDKEWVNG